MHPWAIVGFFERAMTRRVVNSSQNMYVYGGKPPPYHFILTSASFLHHYYFRLFAEKCPEDIRQMIDRQINCEDLAINFLIAQHCNKCTSAFLVRTRRRVADIPRGKSETTLYKRKSHGIQRSNCVNMFVNRFTRIPDVWCTY